MPTKEFDCNNPSDQVTIAYNHKITESTFNNALTNFWGSTAAALEPTVKTWEEMDMAMAGQDCTQTRWKLEMDENDTGNNEIILTIEPMLETIVNYSIALFKGVRESHNAVTFHFYKARKEDGKFDIVFKAVNDNNDIQYYDLSNEYP